MAEAVKQGEIPLLQRSQVGKRLRARRLAVGISQKALARSAGISASYLNLIEHDRRRIGTATLAKLASALDIKPEALTIEAEPDQLVATQAASDVETENTESFAQQFPGWAAVVTKQAQQIAQLKGQISALSDRMGHDPLLAGALHQVLSAVTSIRSTASILVDGAGDRDWERRFHKNVHDESKRLTEVSQALVTYLESEHPGRHDGEADQFLGAHDHHFPRLEAGQAQPVPNMSPAAREAVDAWFKQYRADALDLPKEQLVEAVAEAGFDLFGLSQSLGGTIPLIMRRLATLPPRETKAAIGLLVCDAAGAVVFHKPVAGFDLVRSGGACPNWPIFEALGQPGHLRQAVVVLPEANAPRLTAQAIAEVVPNRRMDLPPRLQATMIVFADAPTAEPRHVGTTCSLCQHEGCDARRVPVAQLL